MKPGIHLLSLEKDIIKDTAQIILETENPEPTYNSPIDLSEKIVVFPTRRIQYFLIHHLTQMAGKSFIAPQMFTIDDFFSFLFERDFPGFEKLNETEAALHLFKIINEKYPDIISYLSPNFSVTHTRFIEFFGWSLKILSSVESIYSEAALFDPFDNNSSQLNEEAYNDFVRMGDYHSEYKELIKNLPSLAKDFKIYLEKKGYFTRGIAYRTISSKAKDKNFNPPQGTYFFVGFHSPNYCEKALFKEIAKRRETHFILKTDPSALENPISPFYLQYRFIEELGYKKTALPVNSPLWNKFSNRVTLISTPDTETEIIKVSQLIKNHITFTRNNPRRTAIVLPDSASLIPIIHGVVSRIEERDKTPFNISLQYPFRRTPLYQLIENILNLNINRNKDGFRCEDYLQIVRHPYVKLLDTDEEEYLKRAIHRLETLIVSNNLVRAKKEQIEELFNISFQGKEKSPEGDKEKLLENIKTINESFIIPPEVSLSETITFLINAVKKIENLQSKYPFLDEYLYLFFNVMEEIDRLTTSPEFREEFNKRETDSKLIAQFILYHLSRKAVPFEGSPLKGIQIIGMLETRGLKFDEVYILDAVEGILPEERKYDPILPPDIKKIFGIRSYTEWELLFAYNFFSLIGSAKRAYIFYPSKKNGQVVSKSRYVEYIIYSIEKELKTAPEIEEVNYKFNLPRVEPQNIEKDDETLKKILSVEYSPSSLWLFLQCPKQFYYSKILGLDEHPEISEEIDGGRWGNIAHEALKKLFKIFIEEYNGKPQKLGEEVIRKAINEAFKHYSLNPEHGLPKLHSWHMNLQINDLLDKQLNDIEKGKMVAVKSLEIPLVQDMSIGNNRIKIKGRIDRVDMITEKEKTTYMIIDYKTGSGFRNISEKKILVTMDKLKTIIDRFEVSNTDLELKNETYEETIKQLKSFQMLFYLYLFKQKHFPEGTEKTNTENNLNLQGRYIYIGTTNTTNNILYRDILEDSSIRSVYDILRKFHQLITLILEDIINPDLAFFQTKNLKTCEYCPFVYLCKS